MYPRHVEKLFGSWCAELFLSSLVMNGTECGNVIEMCETRSLKTGLGISFLLVVKAWVRTLIIWYGPSLREKACDMLCSKMICVILFCHR